MNKTDLNDIVYNSVEGLTKNDVALLVDITLNAIIDSLANGEKVVISSLGTFDIKQRKAYDVPDAYNEGQMKHIPAMKVIHFKPSKSLKSRLNAEGDEE